MQRRWTKLGLGIAALAMASVQCSAASTASVAGVVRNAEGSAQVGAMVQVLGSNAAAIATAFTDIYGRYRIGGLAPGSYRVRATAATFLPATRANLHLVTGMRATVNLTMSMLADPAIWLPAERRSPGEPGDDWTWTLRSAPDRPILRVLGDGDALSVADDDGGDTTGRKAIVRMREAMMAGDAGFGDSGLHDVIALDRILASGSDIVLQADLGMPQARIGSTPSGEISTVYERKGAFGGASSVGMTYASHPEIATADGSGMQWLRLASAEKMQLGDLAELEAGSTVYAIHAGGYAVSTQPFLRVTLHPGQVWAVRYRLATSRDAQSEGLQQAFNTPEALAGRVPVAALSEGHLSVEKGLHQELAVTRKAGNGMVRVAVYHDAMTTPAISGTGMADAEQMASAPAVVDTANGDFQVLGAGYSANGMSLAVAEPIGPNLWGSLEYARGVGLSASGTAGQSFASAVSMLHPVAASTTSLALESKLDCTHTKLRASYRWQPSNVVTAVNAYSAAPNQAYFGLFVRQGINLGSLLPQGLEATVDVTNLLAQGYHPFLSADGRTLYLAQAPRMVRAGLAFNF